MEYKTAEINNKTAIIKQASLSTKVRNMEEIWT